MLPNVAMLGAIGGSVISLLAGAGTGVFLGVLRLRPGLVEYEEEALLAPMGALAGAIGGAIGGMIGAVTGWISKKASWGAFAGSLPLLPFIFYHAFGLSLVDFVSYAVLIIALAIALSGPPLVGALAGRWAKFFSSDACS
jgi:hypothetical protein